MTSHQPPEQPSKPAAQRPSNRATSRAASRSVNQSEKQTSNQSANQSAEQTVNQSAKQTAKQSAEQSEKQSEKQSAKESAKQPAQAPRAKDPPLADGPRREAEPEWLTALQDSLIEALPRLYGVPRDPDVSKAIAALTLALAEGELDCPLPLAPRGGRAGAPPLDAEDAPAAAPVTAARLGASALVQASDSPLHLEGQRLAWSRWQRRMEQVLDALISRARGPAPPWPALAAASIDAAQPRARAAPESQLVPEADSLDESSVVQQVLALDRQQAMPPNQRQAGPLSGRGVGIEGLAQAGEPAPAGPQAEPQSLAKADAQSVQALSQPDAVERAAPASGPAGDSGSGPVAESGALGTAQSAAQSAARSTAAATAAATEQARLDERQKSAVAAVLAKGLVLLEGGPGTGKTSTVAAMIEAVLAHCPEARIQLAAPTGKAAARLRQATGDRHPCSTLHRLLEQRGERFLRDSRHPLRLDVLIVDEVSMVDLELMAALLAALPPSCRLVLVGDPAQLPPVAPGAVLAALQRPQPRAALGDAVVRLETTYRHGGAIAAVAASLRQGGGVGNADRPADADAGAGNLLAVLRPQLERLEPGDNLRWLEVPWIGWAPSLPEPVWQRLQEHRLKLTELAQRAGQQLAKTQRAKTQRAETQRAADHEAAVQALLAQRDRLLLLTPQRRGPWGVETLHRLLLGEAAADPARWPVGTPVLCLRNRDDLGLANGDLGVVVGDAATADPEFNLGSQQDVQRWLVFGPHPSQRLHPAQLAGAVEPALALTVHKSQGSEADEVIVLLPPGEPRDPRLLYTALTRARQRALLVTGRVDGSA